MVAKVSLLQLCLPSVVSLRIFELIKFKISIKTIQYELTLPSLHLTLLVINSRFSFGAFKHFWINKFDIPFVVCQLRFEVQALKCCGCGAKSVGIIFDASFKQVCLKCAKFDTKYLLLLC